MLLTWHTADTIGNSVGIAWYFVDVSYATPQTILFGAIRAFVIKKNPDLGNLAGRVGVRGPWVVVPLRRHRRWCCWPEWPGVVGRPRAVRRRRRRRRCGSSRMTAVTLCWTG